MKNILMKEGNEVKIKEIRMKKIRMKKIKCLDLLLEEASNLASIHPKMHEIFVSQPFQEKSF